MRDEITSVYRFKIVLKFKVLKFCDISLENSRKIHEKLPSVLDYYLYRWQIFSEIPRKKLGFRTCCVRS